MSITYATTASENIKCTIKEQMNEIEITLKNNQVQFDLLCNNHSWKSYVKMQQTRFVDKIPKDCVTVTTFLILTYFSQVTEVYCMPTNSDC